MVKLIYQKSEKRGKEERDNGKECEKKIKEDKRS